MMTLTIFVQKLQRLKRKAESQNNKEKVYMNKSDGDISYLPPLNKPFLKLPILQMRFQDLDSTERKIIFVVS